MQQPAQHQLCTSCRAAVYRFSSLSVNMTAENTCAYCNVWKANCGAIEDSRAYLLQGLEACSRLRTVQSPTYHTKACCVELSCSRSSWLFQICLILDLLSMHCLCRMNHLELKGDFYHWLIHHLVLLCCPCYWLSVCLSLEGMPLGCH